jgi:hypothetical protein
MASITSGPTLLTAGPANSLSSIASLPETKKLIATQALDHLFQKDYFDICQMRSIMKIIGTSERNNQAFALLHALHCVHYKDMRPEVRDTIPHLVREALSKNTIAIHATEVALDGVNFHRGNT